MLTEPEKIGRVAKWAIELGKHDIVFLKRTEKETPAIFLVEIPFKDNEKKEKPKEVAYSNSKWRLYTDRASNLDGSGAWLMLIDPEGKEYTYALRFEFETTNNEAEYEALLADMQERKSWMDPIHEYLLSGLFPEDTKEAKKIRIQAPQYKLIRETCKKDPSSQHDSIAEVAKAIQDCEKCKEQSTTRKAGTSGAIAAGITFGVPWIISSKEEKHFKEGMFTDLCKGLKVTQSFSPVTEHMEIMNHIEKKLTRSQQGWVDNLAKTLCIHRTLLSNSQKETPFSLTYDSEAVIPIIEATDDKERVQKATKGKESKEVASIEKAYYRNKLQKYHNARGSHPMYIMGDFMLLKRNANEWQGPYIINECHKDELHTMIDTANHSLAGSILDYEDLNANIRSHFSPHKKFTKTHLAVHNIKQREGESTRAFITRYTDDTLQILGLNGEQRISGFIHGLRKRSLVEHLSTDLPSTYKGLIEKTYTWVEAREVATNGASSDRRDSFERTAMQKMGILVSTIHGAIKFHTKKGTGTVLLAEETHEGTKRARKILARNEERVLRCVNAEEKIIVNDKYPDQMVTIEKQLPEHFKKELQNLLKSNADFFAWTHADMTVIPRTITVEGKPFNMEHKLNEYSHIKPIKQNKRGLGPDRNMAACKEIQELTKAGILRKAKHQTWVANPVMVKKSDGG
ncbi:reverse transcriptase domain-containing protein [Tanacetum coccineum]